MGNTTSTTDDKMVSSRPETNNLIVSNTNTDNKECDNVNMREKFIERLNVLGHNGEAICALLKHDKCVIAGSFAMQVVTGDNFEDSDIDIFSFDDSDILAYLLAEGYTKKIDTDKYKTKTIEKNDSDTVDSNKINNIKNSEHNISETKISTYRYRINHIKRVTTHYVSKSKVPIQIIVMDPRCQNKTQQHDGMILSNESMNNCIETNFDLDFCKILFDGTNVIKYDNDALKNKMCTFSISKNKLTDTRLTNTWSRIQKYAKRGYTTLVTK